MHNKHSGRHAHNTPAQLANLRQFNSLSPEEHHALSVKGGKSRAKQAAERRTLKAQVEWLLNEPAFKSTNEAVEALRAKCEAEEHELTNAQAMTAALVAKAIQEGDAKAYVAIRDTSGETVANNASEPITITIKTVE